jgi:DnaJ-domain-containing protein 1
MATRHSTKIAQFPRQLLDILRRHPAGLSEYDLFRQLQLHGYEAFSRSAFADDYTLFYQHFLLFNALYRLRDELLASREYVLQISPLAIRLSAYAPGGDGLAQHDPLRDYYLDIRELEKLSASDVADMLGKFWSGFHRQQSRSSALQVLGLADPVEAAMIRQRYRQLAMQHHPDRGGDTHTFQQITAAMRLLEPGFS